MRLNVPDWYKGNDILGMLMYTNTFARNLKGREKPYGLPGKCGINYLHLMPLLPQSQGDAATEAMRYRISAVSSRSSVRWRTLRIFRRNATAAE